MQRCICSSTCLSDWIPHALNIKVGRGRGLCEQRCVHTQYWLCQTSGKTNLCAMTVWQKENTMHHHAHAVMESNLSHRPALTRCSVQNVAGCGVLTKFCYHGLCVFSAALAVCLCSCFPDSCFRCRASMPSSVLVVCSANQSREKQAASDKLIASRENESRNREAKARSKSHECKQSAQKQPPR